MTDYVIDFHAESLVDSKDTYIYYELQQAGLGERFFQEVWRKIEIISTSPLLYSSKSGNAYREAKVKNFPYLIVYRVFPKKKKIFISAIHHTKLHPNKKYRK